MIDNFVYFTSNVMGWFCRHDHLPNTTKYYHYNKLTAKLVRQTLRAIADCRKIAAIMR